MNNNEYVCRKCQLWTAGVPSSGMCPACCPVVAPREFDPPTTSFASLLSKMRGYTYEVSDPSPTKNTVPMTKLPELLELFTRITYEERLLYIQQRVTPEQFANIEKWYTADIPLPVAELRAIAGLPPLNDDDCCGK